MHLLKTSPILATRNLSLLAAIALIAAFTLQYGFGWQPCHLCLWQRVPYGLAILPGLGLLWPPARPYAGKLLAVHFIIWLNSLALAFYHIGVEEMWWSSGVCAADLSAATLDDFYASLPDHASSCANAPYHILGQSLAWWNALLSALCLGYSWITLYHACKKHKAQKFAG